jgi:hypothetical protein
MAAFQPSEDNTHDLGTSSTRWKELYIKDIIASGETRFNVTDPDDGAYTITDGDHIIFHDGNVTIPEPTASNAGRELIIINKNTDILSINVIPSGDNQVYLAGIAITSGEGGGTQLSAKNSIRLISTGTAWYAIAG